MSAIALDPLIAEAQKRARRRRISVLSAVAVLAIGGAFFWRFTPGSGSSGSLPRNGGDSALGLASFRSFGLSFRYPATWKRLDCQLVTTFTDSITYLTNAPTARCSKIPSYKGRPGAPNVRLGEDGVLVYWMSSGYPGPSRFSRLGGRAVTIGGMPARIQALPRSACAGVGGDAGESVAIERPAPGNNWFTATGCFRGSNVSANEAAFKELLASVRISKG